MSLIFTLEESTENKDFRKIIATSSRSQLVNMYLKPYQAIGLEIHKTADQYVIVQAGQGITTLNTKSYDINEGDVIFVESRTNHDFEASSKGMFLIVIYIPPMHKENEE